MAQFQNLFTIQQVSRKLNIPKSTLRFWEKEFGDVLTPVRTRGGQRRYNDGHIQILSRIFSLRNEGMSLNEVKNELLQSPEGLGIEPDSNIVSVLADRVAELVKEEVYRYLLESQNNNGIRK